jgi:WD40 repeat protein
MTLTATTLGLQLKVTWKTALGGILCQPGACIDSYMVNSAAISDDGKRIVAGTYYHKYQGCQRDHDDGTFGLYVFDAANGGTSNFADTYPGDRGIYTVAISGDGAVAAGGGLLTLGGTAPPFHPRGLLRAYDAATGQHLLDTTTAANFDITDRVTSIGLSADGNVLAGVAAAKLYIFRRSASGQFGVPPDIVTLDGYSQTVAVHPSGKWVVAADDVGTVYRVDVRHNGITLKKWTAPEEPETFPPQPGTLMKPAKFKAIAVSRVSDAIAVGSERLIYYLTHESMSGQTPHAIASYDTAQPNPAYASGPHLTRSIALPDVGSFIAVTVNDQDSTGNTTGQVLKLKPHANGTLSLEWASPLARGANAVSVDGAGALVAATDGWPNHDPAGGNFYLLDAVTGHRLDTFHTADMNWPIQISADGSSIVAGSDDNTLYYF